MVKMKKTKIGFILICILLLTAGFAAGVVQATDEDIAIEEVTPEEKDRLLNYLDISVITAEPVDKPIHSFDVNETGQIVLGLEALTGKRKIAIYSPEGEFLYGYEFNDEGSFGAVWDGDNVVICSVRGDLAVWVDQKGEVKQIGFIQNASENHYAWHKVVFARQRMVGEVRYVMRNEKGFFNTITSCYTQVAAVFPNGEEKIIYDVSGVQLLRRIFYFTVIVSFITLVFVNLIKLMIKCRRDYNKQQAAEDKDA